MLSQPQALLSHAKAFLSQPQALLSHRQAFPGRLQAFPNLPQLFSRKPQISAALQGITIKHDGESVPQLASSNPGTADFTVPRVFASSPERIPEPTPYLSKLTEELLPQGHVVQGRPFPSTSPAASDSTESTTSRALTPQQIGQQLTSPSNWQEQGAIFPLQVHYLTLICPLLSDKQEHTGDEVSGWDKVRASN